MFKKLNLSVENLIYFFVGKVDSKSLIAFIIFLSPFTYGYTPVLSYNFIQIYIIIDLLLIGIMFERIIRTGKILRYNFIIPTLIFASSFFLSLFFGLPYSELVEYTVFASSYNAVLMESLKTIPVVLTTMYLIYISIDDISEIFFYIKTMIFSAVIVNIFSFYYLMTSFSGRLTGVFNDSNYLGRFEVFVIAILLLYISYTSSFWKKIGSILFILFSFYLLVFTYSRSSFISLSVAIFIVLMGKSKKKFLPLMIFLSMFSLIILMFSYVASQRTSTIGVTDNAILNTLVLEGSNFTRIVLNIAGFNMFLDNPVFGVGFRNFYNIYLNYSYIPFGIPNLAVTVSVIHSWFFSVLAEQGLFGIIPICYIFFLIFRYFKVLKKNIQSPKMIFVHRTLRILFITLLVNGLFFPHFFFETFFTILMGLIFGYFKVREMKPEEI